MAPVSTYTNPSLLATSFAIVLFPAPAGPSIAILKCFIVSDLLLKFDFAAGRPSRGPGDLKVIPSGHRVQIQNLPGKIQTLHQL